MPKLSVMKKLLIGIFSLTFLVSISHAAGDNEGPVAYNLGTSVTNMAASTTNSATTGTILTIPTSPVPVRIWAYAEGNAATTNGVSAVSNLIVRVSTASGTLTSTNRFDTGAYSPIKLTLTPLVTASNTFSDWFEVRGARYIRVGSIENNYLGSVSNLQIIVGFPK